MKKARQDMLVMAVLMLLSALFYFWFIPSEIRVIANGKSPFSSRTFPNLMVGGIFLVALIGFCKSGLTFFMLRGAQAPSQGARRKTARDIWLAAAPFAVYALVLSYAIAFQYVGFLISTLLFVPAFLALLRCKKWQYYLSAYLFCAVMYLIFIYVLHVPLP